MDYELTRDTSPQKGFIYYYVYAGNIYILFKNRWVNISNGNSILALSKNGIFTGYEVDGLVFKIKENSYNLLRQLSFFLDAISAEF